MVAEPGENTKREQVQMGLPLESRARFAAGSARFNIGQWLGGAHRQRLGVAELPLDVAGTSRYRDPREWNATVDL